MSKFNQFPENWVEITNEHFARLFFHYQVPKPEYRQMLYKDESGQRIYQKPSTSAQLFHISNFDNSEIGIAMFQIYINPSNQRVGFARFGLEEDWMKFEGKFAAQFRGDNS